MKRCIVFLFTASMTYAMLSPIPDDEQSADNYRQVGGMISELDRKLKRPFGDGEKPEAGDFVVYQLAGIELYGFVVKELEVLKTTTSLFQVNLGYVTTRNGSRGFKGAVLGLQELKKLPKLPDPSMKNSW